MKDLNRSQQIVVVNKALKKVKENPLPQDEGGYGKPLETNVHETSPTSSKLNSAEKASGLFTSSSTQIPKCFWLS